MKDKIINAEITVKNTVIRVIRVGNIDYISLTDLAKFKDSERFDYIIQNWLRSKHTIEYVGTWELLYNPKFNSIEFDGFKNEAGSHSFVMTPKEWKDENPELEGNIRDYANVLQLVILSNLENLNADMIEQGIEQKIRLERLNAIAKKQYETLKNNNNIKRIETF